MNKLLLQNGFLVILYYFLLMCSNVLQKAHIDLHRFFSSIEHTHTHFHCEIQTVLALCGSMSEVVSLVPTDFQKLYLKQIS